MIKKKFSRWSSHIIPVFVVAVFGSGLFSRCANVGGAPQGGPKDTLPPRVVMMTPSFNSTNLNPSRIIIGFDEYVQLKDLQKEFFTSPFMEVKPNVTMKNRTVIIDVTPPLDSATTYVFNLGSSVADNNEGNPLHGLKYTFSTGSHIDSMYMSGFVSNALTADTVKGAYIFFYDAKLDTVPAYDSLLFNTQRASAVAKTLSDGGFVFSNLKPIDYRVYAMLDKNGNNMYDPGQDEVAFLDEVYNPVNMPSFLMWYDSVRMHVVAEPQLFFRSFIENPDRRQNLSSFTRPSAQQVILKFSSKHPQIESLDLMGIESDRILIEQPKEDRDSIVYWLNVPQEQLPDTILGRIVYQRHDSLGQLYSHEQELRLLWKKPFVAPTREERLRELQAADSVGGQPLSRRDQKRLARLEAKQKAEEEAKQKAEEGESEQQVLNEILGEEADSLASDAADSLPKSKMKYSFSQDNPVIPGHVPVMTFDLPVSRFSMEGVRLYTVLQKGEEQEERDVPFTLEKDSMRIREYAIRTVWKDGDNYVLLIPPGAVETIDGERNDTIKHNFKVAKNAEMGSVILNITTIDSCEYIVQVMDEKGVNVLREKAHITGIDTIHYITPGKIRLRLIQDRNGNGKWDTGILPQRIQPESVQWYPGNIDLKANFEFEVDIDLVELFRPRVFAGSEAIAEEEQEQTQLEELTGISEKIMSDSGVESFELTDPRAEKKARKAARRAARAAEKAARKQRKEEGHNHDHDHDHDSEESVIPGYQLNYMKDEAPH